MSFFTDAYDWSRDELFSNAPNHPFAPLKNRPELIKNYAGLHQVEVFEKARTLEKYQTALYLADTTTFDKGIELYQSVNSLIGLRHLLVHAHPVWTTSVSDNPEEIDEQDIERKLAGKFEINPFFAGMGNPFFPDKCLSYSCAKWAVTSCLAFSDEFFSRIGIKPSYDHARGELSLDPNFTS